jgi:hypothetical protein
MEGGGLVSWGALIAGVSALIMSAGFWLKIGGKLGKAEAAERIAATALTKVDMLAIQLKEYEVKAAGEFASKEGLVAAENRFTAAVNSLAARFDAMTTRLDRVLETFVDRRPHRAT